MDIAGSTASMFEIQSTLNLRRKHERTNGDFGVCLKLSVYYLGSGVGGELKLVNLDVCK